MARSLEEENPRQKINQPPRYDLTSPYTIIKRICQDESPPKAGRVKGCAARWAQKPAPGEFG